tara:strand:- start:2697 stop:3563 length:867 start_codon:yes stop_codon:yes gene_type:complete
MQNEISPSQILLEISRGYSVFEINEKIYFFKHFSIEEMLTLDEFERDEAKRAKKMGLKNEGELLKDAMKYGAWTQQEEDKIKSLEWTINNSYKVLEKFSDPVTKRSFENQIKDQEEELKILKNKKSKISSYSAEALAQQKKLSKMIFNSLFYDKEFTKIVKDKDVEVLGALVFSKFSELANKENTLKACYLTYFFEVFMATSNCLDLFKTDFMNLTIFQKGLISYSRALMNKIQNTSIPEKIYGDPVKMFDYKEPKKEEKENTTHGLDDLKRRMSSRGGELKAEDFLG